MSEISAAGKRTREETIALNALGKNWLKALFSALRTTQIHDSSNSIFDEPVKMLIRAGDELVKLEGHAEFQVVNDQFFLNRLWIKPTIAEREVIYTFADFFKKSGLGGITIRSTTNDAHWRKFLKIFQEAKGAVKDRVDEMNKGLAEAQIEEIEVVRMVDLEAELPDLPLPAVSFSAVVAYAKVLLAVKEFVRSAEGDEQISSLRKAQRITCELIELAEKYPRLFAVLSTLRHFDTYYIHHSVNVFLLSVLLAKQMKMGRKELVDLGMAALFFDVGKISLPDAILNKPGRLEAGEWKRIHEHPVDSAVTFLSLGYLNESVGERILVGYQHHWATKGERVYPRPKRTMVPTLMAQIVGLCDRYDSLISDKVYRLSLTPRQAIRLIAAEGDKGMYRPDLIDTFLKFLGPLPVGSWVALEDGSEGLVACCGGLSSIPPLPVIYFPSSGQQGSSGKWIVPSDANEFKGLKLKPKRSNPTGFARSIGEILQFIDRSPLLIS
jgi:HD-GYP domain-containing protein (c-di-GMP phosphodiesterase class II)